MTAIYIDQKIDDDGRRDRLYKGDIFVYSANEHSMALIELADGVTLDEVKAKTEAEFRVALKNA